MVTIKKCATIFNKIGGRIKNLIIFRYVENKPRQWNSFLEFGRHKIGYAKKLFVVHISVPGTYVSKKYTIKRWNSTNSKNRRIEYRTKKHPLGNFFHMRFSTVHISNKFRPIRSILAQKNSWRCQLSIRMSYVTIGTRRNELQFYYRHVTGVKGYRSPFKDKLNRQINLK